MEYFCGGQLKDGAIGGKIHDDYQKQVFPNYNPRKGTRDEYRPINRGVVELWQGDQLLDMYVTDTLYNGVYYFWNLQPGTYTVKAKPEGYYPQEQTLEVKQNEISYGIFAMSMVRETPPEVIDYSPKVEITDSVMVSTNVTISFNWDMETEATAAALTITPAVEGTIIFEDDCKYYVYDRDMDSLVEFGDLKEENKYMFKGECSIRGNEEKKTSVKRVLAKD